MGLNSLPQLRGDGGFRFGGGSVKTGKEIGCQAKAYPVQNFLLRFDVRVEAAGLQAQLSRQLAHAGGRKTPRPK